MRRLLAPLPVIVAAGFAGCDAAEKAAPARPPAPARQSTLPAAAVRPPDAKTDQDTNPANLASAVIA